MAKKNEIKVSFENGHLKIVDDAGVGTPSYQRLDHISNVSPVFADVSAINAYTRGKNEFDEITKLNYRIGAAGDDNPLYEIDLHNVTNQPTWTIDQAGVEKAALDLVIGGMSTGTSPLTLPQTDLTAGGAVVETVIPFYTKNQWSIQFVWASLNAIDGTIDLEVSNDGVNFEALDGFTQILMDTNDGSASVNANDFDYNYLKIVITKNSVNAGTIDYNLIR